MKRIAIQANRVSKQFKGASYKALDNVSLKVMEGEFITILGSSGSGKTTFLKMINKLYEPDSGGISLFGEDISKIDSIKLRRQIGYVIQQVGLFPHMTVSDNVAVVPKMLKWDKRLINEKTESLLRLVGLPKKDFGHRFPSQLSGGQQQRIGLARALAADPKLMLLDEPFGALDAITRANLQDELLRIHRDMDKTFLFVTHDISEALKLGTRVIIMHEGKVVQFDTPRQIIAHPANEFVDGLLSSVRVQHELWEGIR